MSGEARSPCASPGTPALAASASLADLLQELVRAKHRLGILCAAWCVRSPSLEGNIALTNMAQEEVGHAMVFEALLHEDHGLPGPARDALVTWETWPAVGGAVDLPQEWPTAIVEFLLLDAALVAVLQGLLHSANTRLVERARKMLQEEQFHRVFALETVGALAAHSPAARARLAALVAATRARLEQEYPVAQRLSALVDGGLLPAEARVAQAAALAAFADDLGGRLGDGVDGR